MDWHFLGHATWLAEVGDLRLLFDPLLDDLHHGGVFVVEPSRTIDVEALRPDFVIVSHAHGDHFDLPSLHRLAKLDRETVLFTADELVAHAARRLGFSHVEKVATGSRIDLDRARLATTPSYAGEIEWGMMVATDAGTVWNQIDSYHPRIDQVGATLRTASELLERDVTRGLPLALVRWQPVLETQAPLAERPGFPFDEWALSLGRVAAIEAKAVIPAAAGVRQTAPYGWMNRYVYPVPLRRAMRDIAARAPGTNVFAPETGAIFRVRAGTATRDGASPLVRVNETFEPRNTMFRPYEMPPIVDPNPDGRDEGAVREVVDRWVRETLAPALVREHAKMGATHPLSYALEVIFPEHVDVFTLRVSASGAAVERELDDDYDVLNGVAGSLLADVIEGRRHWGDPLLGGMIRASTRAYDVNEEGLQPARIVPTFVYAGVPYEESVARAIDWQVDRLVGNE